MTNCAFQVDDFPVLSDDCCLLNPGALGLSNTVDPLLQPAGLESRLIGSHQARNAETAVAAAAMLKAQGFSQISKAGIRAGLESATLLGRFQVRILWLPVRSRSEKSEHHRSTCPLGDGSLEYTKLQHFIRI